MTASGVCWRGATAVACSTRCLQCEKSSSGLNVGPGERSFVEYIGLQSTLEADDGREGAGVYFRCTMYDDASHTAENFWSYLRYTPSRSPTPRPSARGERQICMPEKIFVPPLRKRCVQNGLNLARAFTYLVYTLCGL